MICEYYCGRVALKIGMNSSCSRRGVHFTANPSSLCIVLWVIWTSFRVNNFTFSQQFMFSSVYHLCFGMKDECISKLLTNLSPESGLFIALSLAHSSPLPALQHQTGKKFFENAQGNHSNLWIQFQMMEMQYFSSWVDRYWSIQVLGCYIAFITIYSTQSFKVYLRISWPNVSSNIERYVALALLEQLHISHYGYAAQKLWTHQWYRKTSGYAKTVYLVQT